MTFILHLLGVWLSGCVYKALVLIPARGVGEGSSPGSEQVWEPPVAKEQVDVPWDMANRSQMWDWLSPPGEGSGILASG